MYFGVYLGLRGALYSVGGAGDRKSRCPSRCAIHNDIAESLATRAIR